MVNDSITKYQTEVQAGYFDSIKLKVMDNIKVKIQDVHIRVEHYIKAEKLGGIQGPEQSSFGILLRTFEVSTTNRDGVEVFHDRSQT